jgi:hypothetical protein
MYPLLEIADKLNDVPEQIGLTCVNVGITLGLTTTEIAEDVDEQPFALVTTTVYDPAAFAVKVAPVAPTMLVPLFFH